MTSERQVHPCPKIQGEIIGYLRSSHGWYLPAVSRSSVTQFLQYQTYVGHCTNLVLGLGASIFSGSHP